MSPNHACLAPPPRQHPPAAPSRTPAEVPVPDGRRYDSASRISASHASAVAGVRPSDAGRALQQTSDDGALPDAAAPPAQATAQQQRQSQAWRGSSAGSGVHAKPSVAVHAATATRKTHAPLLADTRAADMLAIAEQLRRTLGMPAAVSTGAYGTANAAFKAEVNVLERGPCHSPADDCGQAHTVAILPL